MSDEPPKYSIAQAWTPDDDMSDIMTFKTPPQEKKESPIGY